MESVPHPTVSDSGDKSLVGEDHLQEMSLGKGCSAAAIGEPGICAAPLCQLKISLDTDISMERHLPEVSLKTGQSTVLMDNQEALVAPLLQ